MNVELTRIAESKIRQLGGDVCGVLVRTEDSEVMAVSEHGRCTCLDAGVMRPVSNVPASDRDEFEKWFSDNHVRAGETVNLQMKAYMWVGFQAARAQSGQDLAVACAYCGGAEKVPAKPDGDGWKVKFMQIMGEIYSDLDDEHEDPIPSDLWDLWRDLRAAIQPPAGQEGSGDE